MGEKTFNLDDIIELPKSLTFKEIDGKFLVLASEKPNWLTTDKIGNTLAINLFEGKSLKEALQITSKRFQISNKKLIEKAKDFLTDIEKYKFYESTIPINLDSMTPPTRLQLYLTNACNLKCIHCYMNATTTLENELSTEKWITLINDFNSVIGPTLVAFSGGEPLIRKDFIEIAKFAKRNKNETFLFTNGTLITERNLEDLINYVDKIQVSIDGANEINHDFVRGSGSFKKTSSGLKLLKNTNKEVTISYCLISKNLNDVKNNLIGFVESLEIKNVKVGVSIARKIGRWEQNCHGCKDSSLGELYPQLENMLFELYSRGWDTPSSNRNLIKRNCTFGQRFVVGAEGNVYPCAETVYSIGNIREKSIKILYERLRKLHEDSSVDRTEVCSPCDLKYICRGGCKTLRIQNFGTPFIQKCGNERKDLIYKKLVGRTII